jgi:hypothetical protein
MNPMAEADDKDTPTAADWQNAINKLSPEEREFLHRPLPEDEWLSAIIKFSVSADPDGPKLLAALFRDLSRPIPDGIRDLLAEMLNPGDPDIAGGRLVFEPGDKTFRQIAGDEQGDDAGLLSLVADYVNEVDQRKRAGEKDASQQTAESVGEETNQSASSVYRRLRIWRRIVARLRESPK